MNWRRAAVGLALIGVLAGCSSTSSASASPTASAVPSGSAGATASCQPLDLRLPSGELVDLTGSWLGDDLGPYEFRQFGDCLWFVGQNATFSYVFYGHLEADFTIDGVWATVSASPHKIGDVTNPGELHIGSGTLSVSIDIGTAATNAEVVIRKVGFTNDPGFEPTFDVHVTTWTKVDDQPDHPFPPPPG